MYACEGAMGEMREPAAGGAAERFAACFDALAAAGANTRLAVNEEPLLLRLLWQHEDAEAYGWAPFVRAVARAEREAVVPLAMLAADVHLRVPGYVYVEIVARAQVMSPAAWTLLPAREPALAAVLPDMVARGRLTEAAQVVRRLGRRQRRLLRASVLALAALRLPRELWWLVLVHIF
jgi:hypothetical protein